MKTAKVGDIISWKYDNDIEYLSIYKDKLCLAEVVMVDHIEQHYGVHTDHGQDLIGFEDVIEIYTPSSNLRFAKWYTIYLAFMVGVVLGIFVGIKSQQAKCRNERIEQEKLIQDVRELEEWGNKIDTDTILYIEIDSIHINMLYSYYKIEFVGTGNDTIYITYSVDTTKPTFSDEVTIMDANTE